MNSINEYVNIYRNFAINHEQLKSFYVGNVDQFGNSKSRLYPALVMTLSPVTVKENVIDFKAQFMVLDRVVSDSPEDILQVQDRTHLICRDIIAITNQVTTDDPTDTDINLSDCEKHFNDFVAGSWCDVAVQILNTDGACSIPIDDTPYPAPSGVNIYDENGTLIITLYPGQSYTVSGAEAGNFLLLEDGTPIILEP
jgi:hypothetical protein